MLRARGRRVGRHEAPEVGRDRDSADDPLRLSAALVHPGGHLDAVAGSERVHDRGDAGEVERVGVRRPGAVELRSDAQALFGLVLGGHPGVGERLPWSLAHTPSYTRPEPIM